MLSCSKTIKLTQVSLKSLLADLESCIKRTRVDSGEVVAVKVIQIDHKYLNEDKSSMKKEIELLSTMSHKNIIKFFTQISPVVGLFSSLLKVVICVAFSSKGAV